MIVAACSCAFTFAAPSLAHVALDTPKSGLTLEVGSTVAISWEDTILHEGIGYDLDLIGADQQIQASIVHELPTTVHSYDWLVPDVWCVGCYLMVTQVNRGQDYSDSALINVYGSQATGGAGGTGGSANESQGGATESPVGGRGGSAGNHASSGASGTAPLSSGGSAGMSVAVPSPPTNSGSSSGGSGPKQASSESSAGAPARSGAEADLGSAGTDVATAGGLEPGAAAGEAAGEAAGDASGGSPSAGGCAIDLRLPSPFALSFSIAALAILLAARKRRSNRRA